jgi:hypothetical protein
MRCLKMSTFNKVLNILEFVSSTNCGTGQVVLTKCRIGNSRFTHGYPLIMRNDRNVLLSIRRPNKFVCGTIFNRGII